VLVAGPVRDLLGADVEHPVADRVQVEDGVVEHVWELPARDDTQEVDQLDPAVAGLLGGQDALPAVLDVAVELVGVGKRVDVLGPDPHRRERQQPACVAAARVVRVQLSVPVPQDDLGGAGREVVELVVAADRPRRGHGSRAAVRAHELDPVPRRDRVPVGLPERGFDDDPTVRHRLRPRIVRGTLSCPALRSARDSQRAASASEPTTAPARLTVIVGAYTDPTSVLAGRIDWSMSTSCSRPNRGTSGRIIPSSSGMNSSGRRSPTTYARPALTGPPFSRLPPLSACARFSSAWP